MKYGLDDSVISQIQGVLSEFPEVNRAILYGSRAMGNFRPGSDIDLTLVGSESLNLRVLYRIMDEIDDLFLPYSFDLSILRLINDQQVREHIRRAGVVFYDKSGEGPAPELQR